MGTFQRGRRGLTWSVVQRETEKKQEKLQVETTVGKGKPALFTVSARDRSESNDGSLNKSHLTF